MKEMKVILSDLSEGGWVSANFKFNWDIVNIMRGLSSKRFNGKTKLWEIPKHTLPELKTKLHLRGIKCIDESSDETIFVRIKEDGFKLSCDDIQVSPISWRLLYLRRPRDGYAYARELEKYGYTVRINDEYEPVPLPQMTSKVTLRPYQKECMDFLQERDYSGVVAFAVGGGKAQPLNTPILTTKGFKTMGKIRPGDYVYGRNGKPVKVIKKSAVWKHERIYEVSDTRGTIHKVAGNHEWLIEGYRGKEHVYTTKELYDKQEKKRKNLKNLKNFYQRPRVKPSKPIGFKKKELPIDPYLFGYWLGDGSSRSGNISMHKEDFPDFLKNTKLEIVEKKEYDRLCVGNVVSDNRNPNTITFTVYNLFPKLRKMGLLGNKHIPENYLFGSVEQRKALIQGLMDSDGSVDIRGKNEFCQSNFQIAYGVKFILDSLGIRCGISTNKSFYNKKQYKNRARIFFKSKDAFRLERKREKGTNKQQRKHVYLEIKKTNDFCDMQCLEVQNKEHIYLTGYSLLPTRNSIIGAEAIYRIGEGPILIVVPTSLLYQWQRVLKNFYDIDADVVTSKIKKEKRKEILENSPIVLTNYELLRTVEYRRQYSLLILDEAHRLRNWKTKTSARISEIVARRVIALTGTPINNHLFEVYNIVEQVLPGSLGTMKEFNQRFVVRDPWGSIEKYKNLEEAYEMLQDVMVRKTKKEMLPDLPELTEELVVVKLTNAEQQAYRKLMGRKIGIGSVANAKVFCSSSSLKSDIQISSKEKELLQIIDDMDERVVIFTQYEKELQRLKKLIREETDRPIYEISGKIKDRQSMIDDFIKSNDSIMIMTEAGSEGIDGLQVCNVLINMDIPYTHVQYEQRVGRIHRSGNEADKVTIINLLTDVTFDWGVLEIVENKKQLADVVIDGQKMSGVKGFLLDKLRKEFEK